MKLRWVVAAALVCWVAAAANAQQILIDQGARVEGMWCFPSATNNKHWYYIPQTARLATDPNGGPVFSFLRYVINRPAAEGDSKGITTADGGGIVTLMATYDTPEEKVRSAERALRRLVATRDQKDANEVVLRGPIIFKSGRYVLISSILRMKEGKEKKETQLLGMGNAPVFEGNEVAFSFDVTAEQSKLLLESFQMATPDISIVFDMTFTGLTDGYDATLTVDWDEVEKNQTIGGGVTVAKFISADIEKGFQELHKSQAIKLVTRGAHPNMEALLDKVNTKLLDVMFKKVEPEKGPQGGGDQGMGMLAGLLGAVGGGQYTGAAADYAQGAGTGALSRNTSSFVGVSFQYEKKELKKSGKTVFHMNNQVPIDRNTTMVANIGDLYTRYKDDTNRFRTVNLSDPAFQQREVHVGIDGAILPEFDKYVNSVTVTLRKIHQNGAQTIREVVLDRNTFNKESRDFRMVYGWNGDDDRSKWLEYEYRTRWSFKGGGLHETDWTKTDINMIDLYAPYKRNTVQLVGDAEALKAQGVRALAVHVEYDFFDGRRSQDLALQTSEPIDGKEIEITLPLNVYKYDYSVTWMRKGAPPAEAKGSDDTGVIFVDEIPKSDASTAGA
jgi:hypothetical protein